VASPKSANVAQMRDTSLVVEEVEFLAGFEADGLAGGDADFGAGARVASDAGLAGAHIEDAESTELDALTLGEGALQALEHRIDRGFGLVALQAGPLNHLVNDVLFYQGVSLARGVSECLR
jgi:hypothetical protein